MKLFTGIDHDGCGMWTVIAKDDAECAAILQEDFKDLWGEPMDEAAKQKLYTAVAKAPRFDLVDGYTADLILQYKG